MSSLVFNRRSDNYRAVSLDGLTYVIYRNKQTNLWDWFCADKGQGNYSKADVKWSEPSYEGYMTAREAACNLEAAFRSLGRDTTIDMEEEI